MLLYHVLVHRNNARALQAASRALARLGRGIAPVQFLQVGAEVGGLGEEEAAQRALIGFLSRVHNHVVCQELPREEGLATDIAILALFLFLLHLQEGGVMRRSLAVSLQIVQSTGHKLAAIGLAGKLTLCSTLTTINGDTLLVV